MDEHRDPTLATHENNLRLEDTLEFLTIPEIWEQIQIVDFPDWRSPIINSRWPFATGKSTSTIRIPVEMLGVRLDRTRIEGEFESIKFILESESKNIFLQFIFQ